MASMQALRSSGMGGGVRKEKSPPGSQEGRSQLCFTGSPPQQCGGMASQVVPARLHFRAPSGSGSVPSNVVETKPRPWGLLQVLQVIVAALRTTEGGKREGDRPRPAKAGRQVIRNWEKLGTVKNSKQAPAGKGLN